MSLYKIAGSYNVVYSIGDLCLTAIELKKLNLRNTSGVFDWVASKNLRDLTRLLKNDFHNFLNKDHLRIIGYAGESMICVADDYYNIVSNHDFPTPINTLYSLPSYPEVVEKYNRRIERMRYHFKNSESILFIRTEAQFEEILELHDVLQNIITHDFKILVINHTAVPHLVEVEWPLANVAVVEFPNYDIWYGNHHLWQYALKDVALR